MATFFDNFNNDPISTTVHTTSYTIPTGGYARVRVTGFKGEFKIDGNVVIDSKYKVGSVFSPTGVVPSTLAFTNDTPYNMYCYFTGPGGSVNVGVDRPDIYTGSTTTNSITMPPGASLFYSSVGPTAGYVSWEGICMVPPSMDSTFWVPEGTLIEGDTFVVELYNKQGN